MSGEIGFAWFIERRHRLMAFQRLQGFAELGFHMTIIDDQSGAAIGRDALGEFGHDPMAEA